MVPKQVQHLQPPALIADLGSETESGLPGPLKAAALGLRPTTRIA